MARPLPILSSPAVHISSNYLCLSAKSTPSSWSLYYAPMKSQDDPIVEHQECHPLPPPPIVCDGVEEYEVEKILDGWIFHGKVEYLVCWKGHGVEKDKWQPS